MATKTVNPSVKNLCSIRFEGHFPVSERMVREWLGADFGMLAPTKANKKLGITATHTKLFAEANDLIEDFDWLSRDQLREFAECFTCTYANGRPLEGDSVAADYVMAFDDSDDSVATQLLPKSVLEACLKFWMREDIMALTKAQVELMRSKQGEADQRFEQKQIDAAIARLKKAGYKITK